MHREKFPKITIVTACLNAANIITAAISSVANQTYSHVEYLVIDGGSVDGTVDILDKYQKQNALQYISEPDEGVYDAMNKGVKLATGEWIFFLGSDDLFYDNEVLERLFSTVYREEQIIYGNVKFLHSGIIYDGPFNFEKISSKNICQQAVFYRKSVFQNIGLFNLRYKISSDHDFNIRWIGAGISSRYIEETIVLYNEKGISGRIIDEVFTKELDDVLINNNIVSSRSFNVLKKRHLLLLHSYKYKIGKALVEPVIWLKSKMF